MTRPKKDVIPKWEERGFKSKHEYIGWLYFNDLTDESSTYDDVYYNEYTGKVTNITKTTDSNDEEDREDVGYETEYFDDVEE